MRFTHEYACWVDASNSQNGPLIPAVAKEITVGGASFDMHQPIKLPKTLFFYLGLQENEWVFSATSERWEHACEHLEPQIFLVA